jgi:hypothetical protein
MASDTAPHTHPGDSESLLPGRARYPLTSSARAQRRYLLGDDDPQQPGHDYGATDGRCISKERCRRDARDSGECNGELETDEQKQESVEKEGDDLPDGCAL